MDPYGLALEAYDGIGRLRTPGPDTPPIDLAVTLPDGTTIAGPVGLKAALMRSPDPFVAHLLDALFVYAVGRPPRLRDRPHPPRALPLPQAAAPPLASLPRPICRPHPSPHRSRPSP